MTHSFITTQPRRILSIAVLTGLSIPASFAANSGTAVSDAHIREVVESLLREKDQKIAKLEARLQQLEKTAPEAVAKAPTIPATPPVIEKNTSNLPVIAKNAPATNNPSSPPVSLDHTAHEAAEHNSLHSQLSDLGEELAELKEAAKEKGLGINGFFDVNAKTDNATDQTFNVGSVELDLEYSYNEHFAASSALVLCGNSSGADFSAPAAITCGGSGPGGIWGSGAGLAVAFVDYHMFDNSIPPRGRIFNNQGFHIQAGRFDLPFSTDYQYFANKDRVTITAPITTARMQFAGYNSDGVRSYGSWKMLNYSAFWTDSVYANDGTSVGGRLGLSFGQNTYRSHNKSYDGVEMGISHLSDLDKNRNQRHAVYGIDLSLGYSFLKLQSEFMLMQAQDNFITDDGTDYGRPNELAFHSTLIADLESFIHKPILAFARYGRWQPKQRTGNDFDGSLVAINNISLLTVGLNYKFNDYFQLKFEYNDSLGTSTQEHYFDKKLGIAQAVVSF
ncbi:MAG: hypothetical protein NTV00_04045 [Methylococcales bacterium]|nr:hypothetical protein [Methylococcales bacterium]